jgi:hypothetical protein
LNVKSQKCKTRRRKSKSISISSILAQRINGALRAGLEPLRERERLSLSPWADRHFWLSPESSGTQGLWETRPFQLAVVALAYALGEVLDDDGLDFQVPDCVIEMHELGIEGYLQKYAEPAAG